MAKARSKAKSSRRGGSVDQGTGHRWRPDRRPDRRRRRSSIVDQVQDTVGGPPAASPAEKAAARLIRYRTPLAA